MTTMTAAASIVAAPAGFSIGDYGLEVTGKPTYEAWVQIGRKLWTEKQKIQWNIGDWINYGESRYGEKYAQALKETDYTLHTLENYASVARKIPVEQRRKNISFSMYQEVAPLPVPEREQLLDGVELGIVNREDVREYKRERREKEQPPTNIRKLPASVSTRAITITPELVETKDGRFVYAFPETLPLWIFEKPITVYVESRAA